MITRRKVRMTPSHHAPYALGDTSATMVKTEGHRPDKEVYLIKKWLRRRIHVAKPTPISLLRIHSRFRNFGTTIY